MGALMYIVSYRLMVIPSILELKNTLRTKTSEKYGLFGIINASENENNGTIEARNGSPISCN